MKLNVGSNAVIFDGWDNLDLYEGPGRIQHDARTTFPYPDGSVEFIYSEHFIEHLSADEGILYFKECHRMLKPGGVIRTATFCIDNLMHECSTDELWESYSKILWDGKFSDLTRIQFFNFAVYEGLAHKCMYNVPEMVRLLKESGFTEFKFPTWKESEYPELQNREGRKNSDCIVEAIK